MHATLCSRNAHKARELEVLMPGWSIETLDADDYPPETGATYYENARGKAAFGRTRAEGWTIGEDSGLDVAALGGRPGLHSARYAPEGAPAIERLLTKSQLPLAGVAESLPGFVVAESDGTIVGTAALEVCCDNALLRSVAVAPEWRSRGLGRALVTRVIADAEARGLRALYLLTTTADRYFPSFGFHEIKRDQVPADVQGAEEFRGACPASAVVMCRSCAH